MKKILATSIVTSLLGGATAMGQVVNTSGGITIPDNSAAAPATIDIAASSVTGKVEKVQVILQGVTHAYPDDLDIILYHEATGRWIKLMSDAGGQWDLNAADLTIDDGGATMPDEPATIDLGLKTGTYKPTNYTDPANPADAADSLLAGAPLNALNGFVGEDPSGKWKLLIWDDSPTDAGSIAGWTLKIWTSVILNASSNAMTIKEDATTDNKFYFTASVTPASSADSLTYAIDSSNTGIVDNGQATFGGSGSARWVALAPKSNKNTVADNAGNPVTITIKAKSGGAADYAQCVTVIFALTVDPVNDAPSGMKFKIPTYNAADNDQNKRYTAVSGNAGQNMPLVQAVDFNDVDTGKGPLELYVTSSDETVVSATNVYIFKPTPAGDVRNIVIAPNSARIITADTTVNLRFDLVDVSQVYGSTRLTNSATLAVTVKPNNPNQLFGNANALDIPGNGSEVRSKITVSGTTGLVARVEVTLADFTANVPEDLDLVLVKTNGPNVIKVALMGQAGGANAVTNARVTFSKSGTLVPDTTTIDPTPFANQPGASWQTTDWNVTGTEPPAAVPTSTPNALTAFEGIDANGDWYLYGRSTGTAASIRDGWQLRVVYYPYIVATSSTTVNEGFGSYNLTFAVGTYNTGAQVTNLWIFSYSDGKGTTIDGPYTWDGVTSSTDNTTAGRANIVNAAKNGGTAALTSKQDKNGTVTLNMMARDNQGVTASYNIPVTVTPVNDPPTMTAIPKQFAFAGVPIGPVNFTVSDVDNVAGDISVSTRSSDQSLLPNANIIITKNGWNYSLMMFPISGAARTIQISVDAADLALTTTQTFDVTINPPGVYLQVDSRLITINDNGPASPFPVTMLVDGLVGKLEDVQVTLMGLKHDNPDDVDILLVGPDLKKIYLMSDAGGGGAVTNGQFVFKAGERALGVADQMTSGYYAPTNYDGGDNATETNGVLATMPEFVAGTSTPNGVWQLYIVDDQLAVGSTHRGGMITGGWMLSLTTQPKLGLPAAGIVMTTLEDNALTTNIVVGDNQPGNAFTVTLTTLTGDPGLIDSYSAPVANGIASLKITPKADHYGTNTMRLTVTDSHGYADTRDFELRVISVADAPVFTVFGLSPSGFIWSKMAMPVGPVRIHVEDAWGESPLGGITFAVASDSPTKIPPGSVTMTYVGNGDWDLRAMPVGTASGLVKLTLTATDTGAPTVSTAKQDINIQLWDWPGLTTGSPPTNPIQIPDKGVALVPNYPSIINVSRVAGAVSKVTVIIDGFHHTYPADVDMLLVHGNRAVMVMSDVGGGLPGIGANDPRRFTIKDDAAGLFDLYTPPVNGGEYKPTNNDTTTDALPDAPAPTGATLATFNGMDPNGDWKLYIQDDDWGEHGAIDNGWILILQTAPKIWADRTSVTTSQGQRTSVIISLGDQDTPGTNITIIPTITIGQNTDANLITLASLSWAVNDPLTGTNRTLMIQPGAHLAGTATIRLVAQDPQGNNSSPVDLNVTVTDINEAPIITMATTNYFTIVEDTPNTAVGVNVIDWDSPLYTSNLVVISLNTDLIPQGNVNVTRDPLYPNGSTNAPLTIVFTPALNANGTATLRVGASDLNSIVTADITVVITPVNDRPTIAFTNATLQVEAGKTGTAYFTVGDVETPAGNLGVFAVSLNEAAVPTAYIELSGSGANRAIKVLGIGDGINNNTATINVYVYDTAGVAGAGADASTNMTTLAVTVTPPAVRTLALTDPIIINDNNKATPYPSVITVSNFVGTINRLNVLIDGFTHNKPQDVDILLLSPNGKSLVLMSDAGDNFPASNVRMVFHDAGRTIPVNGQLDNGTNAPSNYDPNDAFPNDGGNSVTNNMVLRLADFGGISPNGDWKLYVVDDTANSTGGAIAHGWALMIETAPAVTASATELTWNEDGSGSVNITVQDDSGKPWLMRTISSNENLIPNTGIVSGTPVTNVNHAVTYPYTITSRPNAFGTNFVTYRVDRNDGVSNFVIVTNKVISVNDLPTLSRMTAKTMPENTQLDVDMIVQDVDTPTGKLSIMATSSVQSLLPNSGLTFAYGSIPTNWLANLANLPADGYLKLTIKPNANTWGVTVVHLVITDTFDTNQAPAVVDIFFQVTVNWVNILPVISDFTNLIATPAGTATEKIQFSVTDLDSANVTVVGTTASGAIQSIRFFNGTIGNQNATGAPGINWWVQVVPVTTVAHDEIATIDLKATDSDGGISATKSFTVYVRESRDRTFANSPTEGVIIVPIVGNASKYPSVINVSNLVGRVTKVTVGLNGLKHNYPQDLDILLVGPTGTNVVLMSDVGGSTPAWANLKFDQVLGGALSVSSLASGTYMPTNYFDGSADVFPGVSGPYGASLDWFTNASPNGAWKLYIVDDYSPDGGSLTNWNLTITTAMTVDQVPALNINEDTPATVTLNINEESFAPTNFIITAVSDNATLIPNTTTNLKVILGALHPQVFVLPATNAYGSNVNITVTIQNLDNQIATTTFKVNVAAVNDPPFIAPIADVTFPAGGAMVPITLNYGDIEMAPNKPALTITSDTPSVIPNSNIFTNLTPTSQTLWVSSVGNTVGSARITVRVTDDQGAPASTSFLVTLTAPAYPVWANTSFLKINAVGPATPYPSTNTVQGLGGVVSKVTVSLAELSHSYPQDIDMMLVHGDATRGYRGVILMSDAGGDSYNRLSNVRVTFDDAAASGLSSAMIQNGRSYKPTDINDGLQDDWPSLPSGLQTSGTLAGAFNGLDPNGEWYLYIVDDSNMEEGQIAGGWTLYVETTQPRIAPVSDLTMTEDQGTTSITIHLADGDTAATNLTVTALVTGQRVVDVVPAAGGADRSVAITTRANAFGTATVTLTVSDGTYNNQISFNVTVTPVNDPPTISGLANTRTPANVPKTVNFTVDDVDNDPATLTVTASLAVTNAGAIALGGSGANRTLTFTPNAANPVNTDITVVVSDGLLSTPATFNMIVDPKIGPAINPIATQQTFEDVPLDVPFIATTPAASVNVTASAADATLVSGVTVVPGTGNNYTAHIALVPNANGSTVITVNAVDMYGTATATFNLTVVAVNDPPVLDVIPDQVTLEGTPVVVPLGITDVDTAVSDMTFGFRCSKPALLSGVAFKVTGNQAVATITPAPGSNGVALVVITVNDSLTTVSQPFALSVLSVDDPPTLAPIADQTTGQNTPAVVPLTVSDPDTALDQLRYGWSSDNARLVSGVTFNVSGANVTATVGLVNKATGTARVTITVADTATTVKQSFGLTVNDTINDAPTLAAIADLNIKEGDPATVTLNASDLETPLAGLTFGGSTLQTNLVSGFSFANDGTTVVATIILVPRASGKALITISCSDGTNTVSQDFTLRVEPVYHGPTLGPIAEQTTLEDTPLNLTLNLTAGVPLDTLNLAGTSSNPTLLSGISFAKSPTAVVATLTPARNQSGQTTITISVNDGTNIVFQSFVLKVTAVYNPPTLAAIPDKTTALGVNVQVPLVVSAPDSPLQSLLFSGASDNPALVTGITFNVSASDVVATIKVASKVHGIAKVTISVNDGKTTVSQAFKLTVAAGVPVLGPIADQTTIQDLSVDLLLNVSDPDTALGDLMFMAVSSNPNVVRGVNFASDGVDVWAGLELAAHAVGTNILVTVTVSDGTSTASRQFHVTVRPPTPPWLGMVLSGIKPAGLEVRGDPGSSFLIKGSSNLINWQIIDSVMLDSTGRAEISIQPTGQLKFFRASDR